MTFDAYLEARRATVDAALATALPPAGSCPAVILDAMRYSLLGGGKRLRPLLVLAAFEAVQVDAGAADLSLALPAACALEMIHTYSLVHDDLPAMDDDSLRRGRPTSHVVHGEGLAILAGDGLQAEAFALLARLPHSDMPDIQGRKLRTIAAVAEAAGAAGMVGGQAVDLAADPTQASRGTSTVVLPPLDADALADMHARKTGALIRASVAAGAIMGGATPSVLAALDSYARHIGLAFQIVDDILDVEGSSAGLGKTAGKDAAAGKPTYVSLYGLDGARARASSHLAGALDALGSVNLAESPLAGLARRIVERHA